MRVHQPQAESTPQPAQRQIIIAGNLEVVGGLQESNRSKRSMVARSQTKCNVASKSIASEVATKPLIGAAARHVYGSPDSAAPEPAARPSQSMAAKYDKRGKSKQNYKNLAEYHAENRITVKGHWRKDLTRYNATGTLGRIDKIKSPEDLYAEAVTNQAYGLAWEIGRDVEARAFGLPFVALNPEEKQRHNEHDVSRIAIAIKNLNVLQTSETPALTKKRHALAADNQSGTTIDAEQAEDPGESESTPPSADH